MLRVTKHSDPRLSVLPAAAAILARLRRARAITVWTTDAWNRGAKVQNHSHNDYFTSAGGEYSLNAREYDRAVRDVNGSAYALPNAQILLTISGGNTNQGTSANTLAVPPATAKNVLAVGGAENSRPTLPACNGTLAAAFNNIMAISRRGTTTPVVNGRARFKPDVTAPATMVVGRRAANGSATYMDACSQGAFEGNQNYWYHSGTSFAAPAAAGAAIVASRWYSATAGAATPSLVKAMLIGSARNMQPVPLIDGQGIDKVTGQAIAARPSLGQGFGRIHFDRLLNGISQQFYNESYTFNNSGTTFESRILTVRDFSQPVIVALVWTDAPGTANVASPLVNNLDLKVNYTHDQWYVGNDFLPNTGGDPQSERSRLWVTGQSPTYDSVNNVELVRFNPTNNEFRVRVIATQINGDGVPGNSDYTDQDFSLWIYNAW